MNPIKKAKAFKKYISEFGWGGESMLGRIISSFSFLDCQVRLLMKYLETN